ncbi:hypothetical protein PLANPX_1583 [Lacipirellula parvula]|uniref:Uncharacterized protein n=1 Tax=Lacipirellula parvula TaxID=2650471 RepID=A0A5K7XAZ2_9BACT|nr:hypothetical protein PLANPX_1583 [Lacipirellula parvula]
MEQHAFLHKCDVCNAYWRYGDREAHVIPQSQAREEFPDAFS